MLEPRCAIMGYALDESAESREDVDSRSIFVGNVRLAELSLHQTKPQLTGMISVLNQHAQPCPAARWTSQQQRRICKRTSKTAVLCDGSPSCGISSLLSLEGERVGAGMARVG